MAHVRDSTSVQPNTQNIPNAKDESNIILPRSAWNNQVSYFKVLFKVKKALDNLEKYSRVNITPP
jgi:hypothetical protein